MPHKGCFGIEGLQSCRGSGWRGLGAFPPLTPSAGAAWVWWPLSWGQIWQKHLGTATALSQLDPGEKKQGESFLKEATSSWERAASRKGAELSLVMGVRKSRAGFKQFSTEENNECLILSPANSREFSFWIYNQSSVGYQGSSSFSAKSSSIYTKPSLCWGLFLMTPGLN